MQHLFKLLLLSAGLLLSACTGIPGATAQTEVVFPLKQAWVNGHKVGYITTDISDAAMAKLSGVNYVPRLNATIATAGRATAVERVYMFPKGEQINIFQSGPVPTGAANADRDYSPLWRIVLVKWVKSDKTRELKSEEELLGAEDKGDVVLETTSIVANCPVVRGADGRFFTGVR